jgi:hypothetical protein
MISPFSVNNQYKFDPKSNTYQQPLVRWKTGVFYQKIPIYQRNAITPSPPSLPNLFRPLPLKIFRNESAGNTIYNTSGIKTAVHSTPSIRNHLERPGGYVFSKTPPSETSPSTLTQQTVVDSQTVIIGNSTNTVDGGCTSLQDRLESEITITPRSWDTDCLCGEPDENKTQCLTRPKSIYRGVHLDKIQKTTCLTTAGNALGRVRNRGSFNCGGGNGNISYRPQYSSTKRVNSLVSNLNSYGNYRNERIT